MSSVDISDKIVLNNELISELIYEGKEIPNELQLKQNKLMCDYNEAIKKEKV